MVYSLTIYEFECVKIIDLIEQMPFHKVYICTVCLQYEYVYGQLGYLIEKMTFHKSHICMVCPRYGFGYVICTDRALDLANAISHKLHLNGLSPLCMRMCVDN